MEETDIRDFEGKRLPMRPDVVVIDVSFISMKAVLPVGTLAGGIADAFAGADKAAIRGCAQALQARHHPQRDGASGNLRRHCGIRGLARMHATSRCFRHRLLAAMATSSFSSARAVVERLVIDHVGHCGDGVAHGGGHSVYVPYTLPGETVEVAAVPGHPDRRRLLARRARKPGAHRSRFASISGCAGDAQSSTGRSIATGPGSGTRDRDDGAGRHRCEVASIDRCSWPRRRRMTLHARIAAAHDVLKVGFAAAGSHDIIPIDHCPILDPGLSGALNAAWAIAEPLIPAAKPLDIQITATRATASTSTCGAQGPCPRAMISTLSRGCGAASPCAPDPPWRAGADAGRRQRSRSGAAEVTLPPGSFLQATTAGEEVLAGLVMRTL